MYVIIYTTTNGRKWFAKPEMFKKRDEADDIADVMRRSGEYGKVAVCWVELP